MEKAKMVLLSLKQRTNRNALVLGASLGAAGLALATDPTTAEEGITAAKTAILAIVAAGGIAMVLVAVARVGWTVGSKFISRLGSRA